MPDDWRTVITWTPDALRAFEEEVRDYYLTGKLRAPVHLSRGNEQQLIEVFQAVGPADWVFSTYRSHYHALLKGIPQNEVMAEIKAGHSIHMTFPAHRFYSSAIVAGCLPIALGTALGIKRRGLDQWGRVWCFVGDMAAKTGAFQEAVSYAHSFDLPVNFVIECNDLSTNTPTGDVWGVNHLPKYTVDPLESWENGKVLGYCYERELPHYGVGVWVDFDQAPEATGGGRPDVMG